MKNNTQALNILSFTPSTTQKYLLSNYYVCAASMGERAMNKRGPGFTLKELTSEREGGEPVKGSDKLHKDQV